MSPPNNTSHHEFEGRGGGGARGAYDVDETTRLLLGLPCLEVTLGGGDGAAASTATSCCSSACNSPKPNHDNDDDGGGRVSQFLPSLLRPHSQGIHPKQSSSSPQPPTNHSYTDHSHNSRGHPHHHHYHHHHHHNHHHLLSPRSPTSTFPIVASSVMSVFSDIHSECELSKQEIHNESEFYLRSSVVARGTGTGQARTMR
jgi:hypothetical protein